MNYEFGIWIQESKIISFYLFDGLFKALKNPKS